MASKYPDNLEIIADSKHFYSEIKLLFALKRKKPCIYIYLIEQEVCMKSYKTRFLFLAMSSM